MVFFHPRWPVLFEDNHLLVLYKPAGLRMQRDASGKPNLIDLAKAWVKARHAKPGRVFIGMVQRLDAPVAGVVVLARTSKAASRLSEQIRRGSVQKTYLAVVQGSPPRPDGRLENGLVRQGRLSRVAPLNQPGSQAARLAYRLLEQSGQNSLLEVALETGRRHQIRAQLAHLGCPILGDRAYGASRSLPHGCIALLARRFSLTHPTRQIPMHVESPFPAGWPWPGASGGARDPLWAIEAYFTQGFGPDAFFNLSR
jgi:23S rRNA pseudouridine1911/1915/1917 synthase